MSVLRSRFTFMAVRATAARVLEFGVEMFRMEMQMITAMAVSLTDQAGSSSAATAVPVA